MATQDIIPGSKFRLYRENDTTPGTYDFLCMATTISFSRGKDFDEVMVPDCDAPDSAMVRRGGVRSRSWDISFSGQADAKRLEKIEADFNADVTHKYQLLIALPSASGGKTHTGAAFMGPIEIATQNRGVATFSASLRGDGVLTTAAVT